MGAHLQAVSVCTHARLLPRHPVPSQVEGIGKSLGSNARAFVASYGNGKEVKSLDRQEHQYIKPQSIEYPRPCKGCPRFPPTGTPPTANLDRLTPTKPDRTDRPGSRPPTTTPVRLPLPSQCAATNLVTHTHTHSPTCPPLGVKGAVPMTELQLFARSGRMMYQLGVGNSFCPLRMYICFFAF